MKSHEEVSSLAMEGFDIFNVSEYSVLLAADFRRCIWDICMLQVVGGKEVYLFYKFWFPIYQVVDQLARDMT